LDIESKMQRGNKDWWNVSSGGVPAWGPEFKPSTAPPKKQKSRAKFSICSYKILY
jgi:hypothetical protein